MGVLTDFFLASDSDVQRLLRGWQLPPPPLAEPISLEVVNPFTKALVTVRTRRDSTRTPSAVPGADPSPDVTSLPCIQCKGLLPDKLATIFSQLAHLDFDDALDFILCGELAGPPDTEIAISRMPTAFVAALASAGNDELARAAEAVETQEVEQLGDSAHRIASDLTAILVELQALVWSATAPSAGLFIWISP